MSTITMLDEHAIESRINLSPGEELARIRQQKGYTVEYIANKLRLRVRTIEQVENDDFHALPGPVFIKGYLRAYAKLLDVSPEPYLASFNAQYIAEEKKSERALWQQSKRETHKGEYVIRWFTVLFALGVMVAVGLWWQKNVDSQSQQQALSEKSTPADLSMNQDTLTPTTTTELTKPELKLTDISKMQSILDTKPEMTPLEKTGD